MIWLIGKNGMLGQEVALQLKSQNIDFVETDRSVDITSIDSLMYFAGTTELSGKKITAVINCAAYTAVDKAEDEPKQAFDLNVTGVENLAELCKNIDATLIHVSTDYVFGSNSIPTDTNGYTEDSSCQPLGVYGQTKYEGELAVIKSECNSYIFRTAWLYGFYGKNFVYTMTKLMNNLDSIKVVCDQCGTPTNAATLASVIIRTVKKLDTSEILPFGIYHVTDLGQTNWHEFALKIYELGKKCGKITSDCCINSCTTEEYPTKAKRPAFSVLNKEKIQKNLGIELPLWQDSLESFMTDTKFNPELK